MVRQALGMIEAVGLPVAITAADAAVKSANVKLVGYELAKGSGMILIKVVGDVGAVKAAVEAGSAAAARAARSCLSFKVPTTVPAIASPAQARNTRLGASCRGPDRSQYKPAPSELAVNDIALAVPRNRPRSPPGESFCSRACKGMM